MAPSHTLSLTEVNRTLESSFTFAQIKTVSIRDKGTNVNRSIQLNLHTFSTYVIFLCMPRCGDFCGTNSSFLSYKKVVPRKDQGEIPINSQQSVHQYILIAIPRQFF